MATIGRGSATKIAAACDDGTVRIYDSVTGVLRLSLSPTHTVQAMTGSPDGSLLFCIHQESPSITLWDIQTGGLIHTFVLRAEAKDTAVSLNGRYLACALSDGTVNFWEVASRAECPAFKSTSPITCLCWLAPEEQLMVANEASVHIRDIVTGIVLVRDFEIQGPISSAAYSQKLDRLVTVTSSGVKSTINVINPRTGDSSASYTDFLRPSSFAFFPATGELVCGVRAGGLELINVSTWSLTFFDFPTTITSVSALSNRTVVANVVGSGIQLLSLDGKYAPSQQRIPPTLTVHPLDEGRIISIVPITRDRVILLKADMLEWLFAIFAQGSPSIPTDRIVVLCASLEHGMVVHCSEEGSKESLQLWKFEDQLPEWTVEVDVLPSVGSISPIGARLVTFHPGRDQDYVCIWDANRGSLLAKLLYDPCPTRPLKITFESEDRFCSHYDTYRIPHDVISLSKPDPFSHSITRYGRTLVGRAQERQYRVDDSNEWVISGSQRICWIPPGYIRLAQASHCWVDSSLFMAGEDGTLRVLTFRKPLF